jgi:hypothetical protein
MKKTAVIVALSVALSGSAFAQHGGQSQNVPDPNFKQRKTQILMSINAQIKMIEMTKKCVQDAKDLKDLKICNEQRMKRMAERPGKHNEGDD